MNIGYIEWHDGLGYDLDALDRLEGKDREEAEKVLVPRAEKDWRDLEALDRLGTPGAMAAIVKARGSRNPEIRLHALGYGPAAPEQEWEEAVVYGLARMKKYTDGLVYAFRAAINHPSEAVVAELWKVFLNRRRDGSYQAAERLCEIAGPDVKDELLLDLVGPESSARNRAIERLRSLLRK